MQLLSVTHSTGNYSKTCSPPTLVWSIELKDVIYRIDKMKWREYETFNDKIAAVLF